MIELFPTPQIFIQIGPLSLHWYAITTALGAITLYLLSIKDLIKLGYDKNIIDDLCMSMFLFGYIGARLWYCTFSHIEYYLSNPINILKIYDGGLAIQGGILAASICGLYYCFKYKLSFLRMSDIILPNLLIGQAIGRIGNFINQEAYGSIVDESFFQYFPTFIKDNMFINNAYRMPTFLMEGIGNIIGFIIIIFIYKKYNNIKRGDLSYAYLLWYGLIRFFVEHYRSDSLMIYNIKTAQLLSIIFILIGFIGTIGLFRKLIKKDKPLILFDLDGTILDTNDAIVESYQYLFNKYESKYKFEDIKKDIIGPPLYETLPIYFPNNDIESLIKEYKEINYKLHDTKVKLIPNTKEILEYLHTNNYQLGIVSSKLNQGIIYGLNKFDINKYFSIIIGIDDIDKPKPNKQPIVKACKDHKYGIDNTIYIGDSPTDIMAAKNAGVYSIGFIYDLNRKDQLINSQPNQLIENLLDIKNILNKEITWTYNMM